MNSVLIQAKQLLKGQKYQEAIRLIDSLTEGKDNISLEACLVCAEAQYKLGNYTTKYVELALRMLKSRDDLANLALTKYYKARIQHVTDNLLDAQENLVEAYVYYKHLDDSPGIARTSNLLSYIAFQRTDFELFEKYADISLKNYELCEDNAHLAMVRMNSALCEIRRGRLKTSEKLLKRIEESFEQFKYAHKFNYYHLLAIINAQRGNFDRAREMIAKAAKLPHRFNREEFHLCEFGGMVELLAGNYSVAKEKLMTGIKLASAILNNEISPLHSQCYRMLGDVHVLTNDWKMAEMYAKKALKTADCIGERLEIAACQRLLAQIESQNENIENARELFAKSIEKFSRIDARYELAVTRFLAATSDLYDRGERNAMLYLAREYFVSEDVYHYVEKVDKELQGVVKLTLRTGIASDGAPNIIAASPKMKKIVALAEHIANSEMTVLLTGDTGTGKDLLARYIHFCNGRSGEFVSVNSAAIPHDMIEAELFGSKKGAYTGATESRIGLFEQAQGGTFYLNEIADASLAFQAKLLEVLETRQVRRLGENDTRPVSFRLIAATNHDLLERIRENKFRADLYHRLRQIPIELPPLSERPEDIAPLVEMFLKSLGCSESTSELAELFTRRQWPGNVRQLQAEVNHLWLVSDGDIKTIAELISTDDDESSCEELLSVLEKNGWNRREAARKLGISEATVRYRIKKFGITEPHLN